jgi:hypothetical protein
MIRERARDGCHAVNAGCTARTDVVALDHAPVTCVPEGAADSGTVWRVHSQTAAMEDDGCGRTT